MMRTCWSSVAKRHAKAILQHHDRGESFIALHPDQGVVISAHNEEMFQAELAERPPSFVKKLWCTNTFLWVKEELCSKKFIAQ